ncbi:MAG: sugar phosphate isomerase/epimerase family protein [Phycisphaerae bacterium]
MAIKLGTVAPIGFADFPPADWLACLRGLGCTVVQAYRNQQADVTTQEMIDYIAAGGMPCDSLHAIFGEEYDPSACGEEHRRFAVDSYRREADLVITLGGSLVVVHCSTIRREPVPQAERQLRWRQLRKSMAELARHGEQLGVTYTFENLPSYHAIGSDSGELAGVLRELAEPHARMCFDTGHALMVSDPCAAVRAAGDQVRYVHFCDNCGTSDDHEMPTYGALDCDALADALHDIGYDGTMMLEVFHSIDRLNEMIDDGAAERLARVMRRANGGAAGRAE